MFLTISKLQKNKFKNRIDQYDSCGWWFYVLYFWLGDFKFIWAIYGWWIIQNHELEVLGASKILFFISNALDQSSGYPHRG